MINALMVIALLVTTDVLAGAKTYGEKKGYTWEQQIRRGEREKPNLVTARRVFMGWIGENLVCIYVGPGKTNEVITTGRDDTCMGSIQIQYRPHPDFNWRETVKQMRKEAD